MKLTEQGIQQAAYHAAGQGCNATVKTGHTYSAQACSACNRDTRVRVARWKTTYLKRFIIGVMRSLKSGEYPATVVLGRKPKDGYQERNECVSEPVNVKSVCMSLRQDRQRLGCIDHLVSRTN